MINWQSVETVLLDMDGTLLDLHYDNYFWQEYLPEHYARVHNLDPAHSRQMLTDKFLARDGELDFYCIDHWSEQLGIELMPIKAEIESRIRFLPGAVELLEYFAGLPLNTVLLTNAHRKTLELKDRVSGICNYVDAAYASHDFGLPKENPDFWPAFANAHPFDPATTVMIDDNAAVLAAARGYAIAHCVLPLQPDSQKPARAAGNQAGVLEINALQQLLA